MRRLRRLKDDGSTTCASWIYSGVYPAVGKNLADSAQPDAPGQPGAQLNWGWAWPANRRIMYNRASADPDRQTVEREEKMGMVGCGAENGPATMCRTNRDQTAHRQSEAGRGGHGCASRNRSFHHAAGRPGLAVRAGGPGGWPAADALRAGRVAGQQSALQAADSPVFKYWKDTGNELAQSWATRSFPM